MEATHTAGPWVQNGRTTQGYRIDGATERVGLDFISRPVAIVTFPEDARLIAAAPELFELLREFLGHASLLETMSASIVERARAAIAKAEGREVPR